jgi:large subunit ribosomal protein L35
MIPYIPPHPQDGSPPHRYILLLLEQPRNSPLSASALENITRAGFDLRKFIFEHGLLNYIDAQQPAGSASGKEVVFTSGETVVERKTVDVEEGGGIAMWRERWDASVSEIYEKILGKYSCSILCGSLFL